MKLFWRQWHSGKLWAYMITLAYLAGAILYLPRLTGRELVLGAIICPLFLMLYLIPISVFGARVELSEAGLRVQQYGETTIPYSDVLRCYSAFVVPFQVLVVGTRRSLPLKLLYCSDHLTKPRKSLTQDGEIASVLKARIMQRETRSSNRSSGVSFPS
jgi:hypothetical protein